MEIVTNFLNSRIEEYSTKVKFFQILIKISKFLHILSPFLLMLFFFSINIYVSVGIILLYTYLSRVFWVFCVDRFKIYSIVVEKLLEKKCDTLQTEFK